MFCGVTHVDIVGMRIAGTRGECKKRHCGLKAEDSWVSHNSLRTEVVETQDACHDTRRVELEARRQRCRRLLYHGLGSAYAPLAAKAVCISPFRATHSAPRSEDHGRSRAIPPVGHVNCLTR